MLRIGFCVMIWLRFSLFSLRHTSIRFCLWHNWFSVREGLRLPRSFTKIVVFVIFGYQSINWF